VAPPGGCASEAEGDAADAIADWRRLGGVRYAALIIRSASSPGSSARSAAVSRRQAPPRTPTSTSPCVRRPAARSDLGVGGLVASEPLLRLVGVLGAFAALLFAVEVLVDPDLRAEMTDDLLNDWSAARAAWERSVDGA
jgi:hypothetical protein